MEDSERRRLKMNRFKKSIAAVVSAVLITLMVLASAAEANAAMPGQARAAIRSTQHPRPSANAQQTVSPSRRRAHSVRVGAGDLEDNRIITRRRAHLLPYIEQGNVYKLRRP
jgi:hypothetical protein